MILPSVFILTVCGLEKITNANCTINCSNPEKSNYWVYRFFRILTLTSRTRSWHYCSSVRKNNLLSFNNFTSSVFEMVSVLWAAWSKLVAFFVVNPVVVYLRKICLITLWYLLRIIYMNSRSLGSKSSSSMTSKPSGFLSIFLYQYPSSKSWPYPPKPFINLTFSIYFLTMAFFFYSYSCLTSASF